MAVIDSFLFGIPINAQTALISVLLIWIVILIRRGSNQNEEKKTKAPSQKERSVSLMCSKGQKPTIIIV